MHTLAMILASETGSHLLARTTKRPQPAVLLADTHRVISSSLPNRAALGALHQDQR